MKMKSRILKIAAAVVAVSSFGLSAQAQTTFIKADNTTSLNLAASYTANSTVPTAVDTIQVDNTLTATRTASLGGNLSISAFTYNSTSQFQVANTANAVLTIGSGGVTKTGGGALIFANAVTLGNNQNWTITGGGTGNLQMNGAFNDGGRTLNVVGNGTFDLRGNNTFSSNVVIDTTVSINGAAATVTFGGANTFNAITVAAGKVSGSSIGNFGVASSFGDGGTNTAITLGGNGFNGVLEYTGNSASSNRTFTRDQRSAASGINVSTSGQTLTISGALGSGTNNSTSTTSGWVFGGAGNLALSGAISDAIDLTGTTNVTKNDLGTLTRMALT